LWCHTSWCGTSPFWKTDLFSASFCVFRLCETDNDHKLMLKRLNVLNNHNSVKQFYSRKHVGISTTTKRTPNYDKPEKPVSVQFR
jgi:ribosomal protein L44E